MPDLRPRIERSIQLSGAPIDDHSMGAYISAELFVGALVDDEILPPEPAEVEATAVQQITEALRGVGDFRQLSWSELAGLVEPIVAKLIEDTENADA